MCHGMSPWREPDYTHFPSTAVLSHCVGLYFIHFHPILPILRPKAYMDDQGAYQAKPGKAGVAQTRDEAYLTLLTLTVAAIGAAYAEDRMKPLGGYLMELARRTGSYLVCRYRVGRALLMRASAIERPPFDLFNPVHSEQVTRRRRRIRRWVSGTVPHVRGIQGTARHRISSITAPSSSTCAVTIG